MDAPPICMVNPRPVEERVYKPEIPNLSVTKHLKPLIYAKELVGFHKIVKMIPKGVSFKDACEDFCFFQFFENSR